MISKNVRTILIPAAILLIVVLGVLGVRALSRDTVIVRTAAVSHKDIITTTATNGKVEPIENFSVHAAAPGVVNHIYVKEGQQVPKGTLLLTMENADAQARVQTARTSVVSAEAMANDMKQGGTQDERIDIAGNLDRARLQADQARHDLATIQQLQTRGAASAGEVAQAQARLASAESSYKSLSQRSTARYSATDKQRTAAQLADSRAALSAAESILGNTTIRAPFAGTVYALPVRQYDFAGAGEPLLSLADLNKVQVRAYFDEPEIGKLHNDQPVTVTWEARAGRVWHGHIVHTPTTVITYGTRNVGECLIAIDDAGGDLLPNTNVNATVTTDQKSGVLSIPREALRTEGTQNFVFRVVKGKLVRTLIDVGVMNLKVVEVRGGLSQNDTVALNATNNIDLTNGLQVEAAPQTEE